LVGNWTFLIVQTLMLFSWLTLNVVMCYGAEAECRYGAHKFEAVEGELESDWHNRTEDPGMRWNRLPNAVKDSYERTAQIRRARDVPEVCEDDLKD
jgi:hypothetical protein